MAITEAFIAFLNNLLSLLSFLTKFKLGGEFPTGKVLRYCARVFGSVLRIWDVYPGSRILIFTHPGSRIPDLGSRIQNSNKFQKIVNY
jgi:hypothetical protein